MSIPQASPSLRVMRYYEEITDAINSVISSDQYILGNHVLEFENAFSQYCGVSDCVAVNSGTDAIEIALRAVGVKPGDEVITVSMTAPGTALGIVNAGAIPVFVDINPTTLCLDTDLVEEAITDKTAAVIPVHTFGYPMDLQPLLEMAKKYSLSVIEDCAHAHGAGINGRHVGTFGDAGAFSFYPTKNLGCIGDGGAVITNNPEYAQNMRTQRSSGAPINESNSGIYGPNSRLDSIQASVLRVLLEHLDEGNEARQESAGYYQSKFDVCGLFMQQRHPGHVYHQFIISTNNRDELQDYLMNSHDILTGRHYDLPLHQNPIFKKYSDKELPITENLARTTLSLPIQPEISLKERAIISDAVLKGVDQCSR